MSPFSLNKFLRVLAAGIAFTSVSLVAQTSRNLGDVVIRADLKTISVTVSGSTTELDGLANLAFNAHGRYRRVASGGTFDIKFTAVAANQVQVTVTKAGAVALNQVAQGTSTRNAFFRAADAAVTATSGLKGIFASRLAFISEYSGKSEVFTGDLFFGEVRQITKDNAQAIRPRWSPDGGKILYTSFYKSGFPDIFLLDLNSMQRSTFVSFKGTNSGARFSPNGSQVAMVLSGEGNPEIYVSNAQGRGVARRTRTGSVEASPAWSPDGSRIVFTSDAAGGPQLYVMPAAGGTGQRLPTNISGYCAEPDWSLGDPNKIAFTTRIGRGYQIAVYDLAGRSPTKVVSKAPVDAVEPAWLADGRHLVYTERAANSRSICILDTETGKTTRLSPPQLKQTSQASVWIR
ncbi:PD40 domain-containing protein [Rariglobus hedericola]|uniref:Biopolymer transporter Tol n=1 Tax=Rariglobus hedericola TaxID=2597822 RepID=A0A556QR74_9BACT|nr:PD40 domain-containing protein [Rariglobus hedericola]TSJ79144.1 biopolymer transporter Tol [Rariglobus hedericola]